MNSENTNTGFVENPPVWEGSPPIVEMTVLPQLMVDNPEPLIHFMNGDYERLQSLAPNVSLDFLSFECHVETDLLVEVLRQQQWQYVTIGAQERTGFILTADGNGGVLHSSIEDMLKVYKQRILEEETAEEDMLGHYLKVRWTPLPKDLIAVCSPDRNPYTDILSFMRKHTTITVDFSTENIVDPHNYSGDDDEPLTETPADTGE